MAYRPTQLLLGLVAFILLIWISGILVGNDPALGDPFKVLTTVIDRFQLDPFRFPILFVASAAILGVVTATYVTTKRTLDLRAHGIKAVGHVTGFNRVNSRLHDGTLKSGVFPLVAYSDSAGQEHTISESTVAILSRLRTGDAVEIIYLARQPDRGVRNSWLNLWIAPLFFGFMALGLLWLFSLVWSGILKN